jgi:hypothetical protein
MRKLHKYLLGAVVALAAVALSAPVASGQLPNGWESAEARDQDNQELCPELVGEGTVYVGDGCLVEGFDGSFRIHTSSDPGSSSWTFDSTFDVRVGPNALGYAVNQTMAYNEWLDRVPCDDSEGNVLPWRIGVLSDGNGGFLARLNICVRVGYQPPGYPGSSQWITLDVDHFGADGWTELNQSDLTTIQGGHWESDNTVFLSEL